MLILPIAGKTIRHLVYENRQIELLLGYLTRPLTWIPESGAAWRDSIHQVVLSNTRNLEWLGWLVYGVIPVAIALVLALWLKRAGNRGKNGRSYARWSLFYTAWVFFLLNFGFFNFSWPWKPLEEWTGRTPNATLFAISLLGITLITLLYGHRQPKQGRSA